MAPDGTTLTGEVAILDAAANTASSYRHVVASEADIEIVARFDPNRLLAIPARVVQGRDLSFTWLAESLFAEDWECPEDAAYDDL